MLGNDPETKLVKLVVSREETHLEIKYVFPYNVVCKGSFRLVSIHAAKM